MEILQTLQQKLRSDRTFHGRIVRSSQKELFLDIDGDGNADLALLDISGNGEIDFLAVDTAGNGELDLFIGDTDENGLPTVLRQGKAGSYASEAEHDLIVAASIVRSAVLTGDYIPDTFSGKLDELLRQLRRVQNRSNK